MDGQPYLCNKKKMNIVLTATHNINGKWQDITLKNIQTLMGLPDFEHILESVDPITEGKKHELLICDGKIHSIVCRDTPIVESNISTIHAIYKNGWTNVKTEFGVILKLATIRKILDKIFARKPLQENEVHSFELALDKNGDWNITGLSLYHVNVKQNNYRSIDILE